MFHHHLTAKAKTLVIPFKATAKDGVYISYETINEFLDSEKVVTQYAASRLPSFVSTYAMPYFFALIIGLIDVRLEVGFLTLWVNIPQRVRLCGFVLYWDVW